MKAMLLTCCVSLLAACAKAPDPPGPALLFAGGQSDFSAAERLEVFNALYLNLTPDGKGFVDQVCGQPADAVVEFRDMNHDGKQEALVLFGNGCTSGHTERSMLLFTHGADGHLQSHFGFPAASADPMPDSNLGYPDLLVGGPGFCFGVWRWDGKTYNYLRDDPQMPGGCDHIND